MGAVGLSTTASAATTINLGEQGLSEGDDISPYLDQYWQSGNEVVIPAGSYQLSNNGSIGFDGSDAVLRGDGTVELHCAEEITNPNIMATGGTVRIENVTIRNNPSLGGIDIDVQNGATLEFVNFNLPDGQSGYSEMYPAFLNRADASGTVRWDSCTIKDQSENGIYTGQSPDCRNIVENCTLVRNNIDQVRVGGNDDVVRNNTIVLDDSPPAARDGGVSGRGIRVRYGGSATIENNTFEYSWDGPDPLVIVGDADLVIRDNEVYSVTDWAMRRNDGSGASVSGSGNVLTGPTTEIYNLPYDSLISCPDTEGGDGSNCTSDGGGDSSGFSVSTVGTASVGDTTATLEGSVDDLGGASSADAGFEYREAGASSWNATATQTLSATGSFSQSVDGLSGGTNYEFRAVADASDGDTDAGSTDTFVTSFDHHLVIRPEVDSGIDYEFTTTGLMEFGPEAESKNDSLTQNSDGSSTATGYVTFDYTDDYRFNGEVTDWSATQGSNDASGEYELVLDGTVVTPDELVGDSGVGVATGSAADVTDDSATLNGSLDDLGGASSADVGFEYREAGASSWNATATRTLSATGSFSQSVDGLSGGTNYEFRAVASASDGDTDAGSTASFFTSYDHHLVIRPGTDAAIDYEFTTSGAATRGPKAESKNDSLTRNSDGSSTVTGWVMYDYTDDWRFNGEVTDWSATQDQEFASGEYELVLDGTVVTPDELVGGSDGSPPAIDRYEVQEEGSPNPHADITVDWGVSDPDGDLSGVLVEVLDSSGSVLDEANSSVSGNSAYDLDYFRIKDADGQSFTVRLTVTDAAGASTSTTRSVTE